MGRTTIKIPPLFALITLIFFTISISNFHAIEAAGFTIDLIHRDSLQSPFLHSPFQGIEASLRRSFNRAKTLTLDHSLSSVSADIIPDPGEYLMRFVLGTPKVETLAYVDTGSDLTWIQCWPCKRCFKQKTRHFSPKLSSSYKPIPCLPIACESYAASSSCNRANGTCGYSLFYGDGSRSVGEVATEKVTLGNNVTIPKFIIGCGRNNDGTFSPTTAGIVGLGGGKGSLLRQLGPSIRGRFSYCFVPRSANATKPSKIHFGDKAEVSGAGVVTTPIVVKSSASTLYYLTLLGISIGTKKLELNSSSYYSDNAGGEGNIIIDSGTTLTLLPRKLYEQVEAAVIQKVRLRRIRGRKQQLNLCYDAKEIVEGMVPDITVHFRGADVKLKPYNLFIETGKRSQCFAFMPSDVFPIYGNMAQMNFLIGYDLVKRTVSFKPTDCTRNV